MADLLSVDEYKEFEGIIGPADDDKLEKIAPAVSNLVKTYCGSSIIDNSGSPGIQELFDIQWDTHVVQLDESPIISITSVEERGSQSEAYTTLINDGTNGKYEWYLDAVTDSVFRTNADGSYALWPRGVGSVRITYLAGYTSTPEDLKLAIVDLINYYFRDEHITNRSQGAASLDFNNFETKDFPNHIKRVLDFYKVA